MSELEDNININDLIYECANDTLDIFINKKNNKYNFLNIILIEDFIKCFEE